MRPDPDLPEPAARPPHRPADRPDRPADRPEPAGRTRPADPEPCPVLHAVTGQADLERLWRTLMGPLGFGGRSLWLMFLDPAGHPGPRLTQVEDLPVAPDAHGVRGLVQMLALVRDDLGPEASVALLLSRPGVRLDASDRAWAAAISTEAARVGLALWPTHVATDHELRVVAPDDLPGLPGLGRCG